MRFTSSVIALLVVLISNLSESTCAFGEVHEYCLYQTSDGKIHQVTSRLKIPLDYRGQARCFSAKAHDYLAQPEDIKLKGTVRAVHMASAVGQINLRWPRKVEVLFGRTPERALAEAARTVARTLKQGSFSSDVRSLNLDWQVVFLDEELPEAQIPTYLINNCHPAWMTPPANMYFIAQRIVAGCGNRQKVERVLADSQLVQVLLHEMGHVVEYQLLAKQRQPVLDRMRSEGFATWFEGYAADFTAAIPKGRVAAEHLQWAQAGLQRTPALQTFSGSAADYAQASLYFRSIVERRGVQGLMDVYSVLNANGGDFFRAVQSSLGWNRERLEEENARLIKENQQKEAHRKR